MQAKLCRSTRDVGFSMLDRLGLRAESVARKHSSCPAYCWQEMGVQEGGEGPGEGGGGGPKLHRHGKKRQHAQSLSSQVMSLYQAQVVPEQRVDLREGSKSLENFIVPHSSAWQYLRGLPVILLPDHSSTLLVQASKMFNLLATAGCLRSC